MDLHRTDKVPQWETIPEEKRNKWQKRAAETNGWDTPANRESAKGLVATLAGIGAVAMNRPFIGAALLAYGRYKDIRDGKVAEATGTKSPKGEAVDATVDKVVMAAALPVLAIKDVIPVEAAVGLAVEQGLNVVFSGIAKARKREIHSTLIGKVATLAQWVGMGAGVAAKACEAAGYTTAQHIFQAAEIGFMGGGLALGAVATAQYAYAALGPVPTPKPVE